MLSIPLISQAALNKCTDAKGAVSYSDRPCLTAEGLKPAEIKNATAFEMINAREHHRELATACMRLKEKIRTCNDYVEPTLYDAFNTRCEVPIRRRKLDEQSEQQADARQNNYRERQARRQHDEYENDREAAKITCGDVDAVVYGFVKDHFSSNLSEDEMKKIDAAHNAIQGGSNTDASRSTRRSKYKRD